MNGLLLATVFLPLIGAVALWIVAPLGRDAVRWATLAITVATFACAARLISHFPTDAASQASYALTEWNWVGQVQNVNLDIRFALGLDGLGLWMFGLSALLMITSVLVSWEAIKDREPLFFGMLLLLEFGCLGVFSARDIVLFYIFFEFTLIPLFFLIGIWGSEDRRYAASKFFLYTLAGSMLTFLGLLAIVFWAYGPSSGGEKLVFSIPELTTRLSDHPIPIGWQIAVFVALFAGFAIKVPLFPLHTWLPLAHVQAPTAGSVILAGILLKIGVYGFLRFSVPMLPQAAAVMMPWLLWLSVAGIIYGALVALAQSDIKRLIAYSSVSHLGFCMLGLFAFNPTGVQGSVLQMVNHGISTGGLFALVGMIYERYHTREIASFGGLARKLPILSLFMLLFTFSSIGLPGMNGFAGEFLILLGIFQRAWTGSSASLQTQLMVIAVLSVSGVVLGAWYMLHLIRRVFFGPLKEPHAHAGDDHAPITDMNLREILALAPLLVFVFWIGLRPGDFLTPMNSTLDQATSRVVKELDRQYAGVSFTPRSQALLGNQSPEALLPEFTAATTREAELRVVRSQAELGNEE